MNPASCVVLVPFDRFIGPECERSLHVLEQRGYPVWRVPRSAALDLSRCLMARDALTAGFAELLWIDSDIVFHPDDVDKLRSHALPLACGLTAQENRRELTCAFLPGTPQVHFGQDGGLMELRYARFAFMLTRRYVYEELQRQLELPACNQRFGPAVTPWFLPLLTPDGAGLWYLTEDYAFCERARRCGLPVMADTTIRLGQVGRYEFSWEDAGSEKERYATYTFHLPADTASPQTSVPALAASLPASRPARGQPPPLPLREKARPLSPGFPRLGAYLVSYPSNHESLQKTLASFRASDWGSEPTVFVQPADWPIGRAAAARNYQRALQAAAADGCDFAVILEDDVRVNRSLRHNLCSLPLLRRDQCDYFSLFLPDLIATPWQRQEPHLGYRLAKPLYSGPDRLWEKYRLWGAQGYVLSRRFLLAALERWDSLDKGNDSHIIQVCSAFRLPLWYSAPCLVQHAPLRSAHGTPAAYAADFHRDFRFQAGPGFQPPEAIAGWLTVEAGRLLWQLAAGRRVLEVGTALGQATVCLAQQARQVVTLGTGDSSEAREWVKRYGLAERVAFERESVETLVGVGGKQHFDLVLVNTEPESATLRRIIDTLLPLRTPGDLITFSHYPDPEWPDVRRVVDEYANRHQWRRMHQVDYLGVFHMG